MPTTSKQLMGLTAGDLMTREVVRVPEDMPLRIAAQLLWQHQIGGAPVVDATGKCVGVLSATDFVHWAEDGGHGAEKLPFPVCPYQVKGRLLTGEQAVICTLAEGSCPFQKMRPTMGGGHTALCMQPSGVLRDWQHVTEKLPVVGVHHYMSADVVTVGPQTPLRKVARAMIDAHIHRVIVVDEERKPIGVVSSTDILAAMAYSDDEE